jgi:hypothetical protein
MSQKSFNCSRTEKKSLQKNVSQNGAVSIGTCREIKRRTRSWSTPHAKFAISPREVDQLHRRNLAEKYAGINKAAHEVCTFFARHQKIRLRKPPILG